MHSAYFSGFGTVLLFLAGGAVFIVLALGIAALIRPGRPNPEKLAVYECGEEASGTAWGRFNIRFYVIALVFILFEVEIVFLFPWATVFAQKRLLNQTSGLWGWYTLAEMFIFVGILAFGLAYAWKKRFLEWEKPAAATPQESNKLLESRYGRINEKYRNFTLKEVKRS